MSNYLVSDTDLTSVANAIRTKGGTSAQLEFPSEFVSAIGAISGGGGAGAVTQDQDGYLVLSDEAGGGGDYTVEDIAERNYSGNIVLPDSCTVIRQYAFQGSGITGISAPKVTSIDQYAFSSCTSLVNVNLPLAVPNGDNGANSWFNGCTGLTSVYLPKCTKMWNYFYQNCSNLESVVMPALSNSRSTNFNGCTKLKIVDLGTSFSSITSSFWTQCTALNTLVLRRTAGVCSLGNINAFATASPFGENGTGGTLYVPNDLISSYTSASNWSTILGYTNNQIKSIESTHTDPNAPIDLTLYYADGTLIPTT